MNLSFGAAEKCIPENFTKTLGAKFYATVITLGLLDFIVITGNFLVIAVFVAYPKLRCVTTMLITSLAVADLLVGVLVLPFSATRQAIDHIWVFGPQWCNLWLAVDVWMCTASIYNLVVISLERYIAIGSICVIWLGSFLICCPPILTQWTPEDQPEKAACDCTPMANSPAYVVYSAMGSFFLPMFLVIVIYIRIFLVSRKALYSHYAGFVSSRTTFRSDTAGGLRVHRGSSVAVPFNPPQKEQAEKNLLAGKSSKRTKLTVKAKFSVHIEMDRIAEASSPKGAQKNRALSESPICPSPDAPKKTSQTDESALHIMALIQKRARKKSTTGSGQRLLNVEIKAAKTVGIVTGCFIVCWLGFSIVYVMQASPACPEGKCVPDVIFAITFWLGYINSALNPLIYAAFNRKFRSAFRKLLTCKCVRKNEQDSSMDTFLRLHQQLPTGCNQNHSTGALLNRRKRAHDNMCDSI